MTAMPAWTKREALDPLRDRRAACNASVTACRTTCGSPSTTRATRPARSSRRRSGARPSSPSTAWASGRRAASASAGATRSSSQRQLSFPHSLGLLYSAFTYFSGFRVNCGEYKLMGLAPYGEPVYAERILDHLIDLRPDGSFRLDMKLLRLLLRPDDDQPPLRRALRRSAARARVGDHPARDGPRRVDPGGHRGDRAAHGPRHAREVTGERDAVPGRRRGAQLRGQRAAAARRAVRAASGSSRRRATRAGRWARPSTSGTRSLGNAAHAPTVCTTGCRAPTSARASRPTRWPRLARRARAIRYERVEDEAARAERIADAHRRRRVVGCCQGRMEFGPRALGPPVDRRRSAVAARCSRS